MPPIFSSTLRAWATARATMALHAAESPPPAQDLAARKFGSGLTLRAGFFGGRTPLSGTAAPASAGQANPAPASAGRANPAPPSVGRATPAPPSAGPASESPASAVTVRA